jgi:hypothetical protein
MNEPHQGPPDRYLVTRAVSRSEAPEEVREMAEVPLGRVGLTFADVAFVAEVRDADLTGPLPHPEWLVGAHGPIALDGMVVRTGGSWGSGSHRFSIGGGRERSSE